MERHRANMPENRDTVTAMALRAIAIAEQYHHETVTLEHILLALLERTEVQKCLKELEIDGIEAQRSTEQFLSGETLVKVDRAPLRSQEFDMVMGRTIAYAKFSGRRAPSGVDILLQIVQYPDENSHAVMCLLQLGLEPMRLKRYVLQQGRAQRLEPTGDAFAHDMEPQNRSEAIAYIKKYCTDLNELARQGKIDPVIGRTAELHRIAQIISRRGKNNVALVGEPGVGKSSVVEGLAFDIVHDKAPAVLKGCNIWSLDVGSLVAGTRFRGDFEERMKFLLKSFALLADEQPILFIDEIHMIMDAGTGNRGSLDISNLIKPALARGTLRCIGATTNRDWRQHFAKDRALVRRFKKLTVHEPSIEDAKLIVRGRRPFYEDFYGLKITDAALDAAVDLTARYVHDGRLPDKALDVIDEAGARQKVAGTQQTIDVAEIEVEVATVAKLPLNSVNETDRSRLQRLETDLLSNVFGQDQAIKRLVNSVLVSRAGLRETHKPEGCFLFVGPTGVGKSATAQQLAATLGVPLVKFDMSEYSERHSISRLTGAPPGYVGFRDGDVGDGLLVNAIETAPSCVLLLDEIEKAHPDLFNLLLQVMDDAHLTSAGGKTVSFRSVIVIMTSNAGVAKTEHSAVGFIQNDEPAIDEAAIKQYFSPEFRNRLDAIASFRALDKANIARVVDKFLVELREMVTGRGIILNISDAAKKWLVSHGYDAVYGARPLGRLITEQIKCPLSRLILFGDLKDGGTVDIHIRSGMLSVIARTCGAH